MAKTATEMAEQITALTEQLHQQAATDARKDIATEFATRSKTRDLVWFASVAGRDVALTPDFLAGVALVCKALKDRDFDY